MTKPDSYFYYGSTTSVRKQKPETKTVAINGEKKLTSMVEQPVQYRSSMLTPNGGEEAPTTNKNEMAAQGRRMEGARMECVKGNDGCTLNF